ncbi:MAG: hypothetical protein Q4P20_12605 [Eubacteriales bacterium]|nr:hypothetical protein [Eubacteriales bacterium]
MDNDQSKNSIRPDFLKKSENGRVSKSEKALSAASSLASMEQGALADVEHTDGSLNSARTNEASARGFYSGAQGKNAKNKKAKGKGGFLKQRGPLVTIFMVLLGIGGLASGAQLFQPFSLLEQFRETFNSMQTATNARSNRFLRMQMDSGRVKDPIKARIFRTDTFKITSSQAKKLSVQGIYYDDNFEGTGIRVLKFDDGTGELRIVAADDASAAQLKSRVDIENLDVDADLGMKYNAEPISFANLYANNTDFFHGYNKGSMTWRGAIANWFGTLTANFLSSNKLTRNLFKNFQQEVAASQSGNTRTVALDLIAEGADKVSEGGNMVQKYGEDTEVDENGNPTGPTDYYLTENEQSGSSTFDRTKITSQSQVAAKLQEIGDKYGGTASNVANYACLGLNFLGGVSLLVSASEALQVINLVTAYFEAIDKVRAGDGDDSPIHDLTIALNEKKTSEYNTMSGTKQTLTGSAMESSGIVALYGGNAVNPNNPSVKSFNFTSSIKTVLGGIGVSMTAFETCSFAKIAAAAVNTTLDGIKIAGCIAGLVGAAFTFGMSAAACSGLALDAVVGIGLGIAASTLIAGIISMITPVVADILTRDLITDIGGVDLGNALTSGANMYLGNTHRSNGGSLASESKYIEFAYAQQQVIAENAKYERMDKSPFDASSQHTFLGTLATQLMAFASANSLMSFITSSSSVIFSAATSLMPTSSAYNIAEDLVPLDEYAEICPYLASIGAVGDMYCNPYAITDMSTMDYDPADVADTLDDNFLDETTEDGNVIIDGSSDLAKYILFCDNRTSAFGIADQNIVNQISSWGQVNSGSSDFDNITNSAIGAVPIVGDVIDIVDNAQALNNAGYIGGESCVAGNTVNNIDAPDWDTAKYYQRFIEDQSLAESLGLIEESAVTAYLDDYYEANPLDQSYEGILARYSGLEKEDVIALLDIIEYESYIANYDPSTRYAFVETEGVSEPILFEESDFELTIGMPVYAIVYADLRNRNYAA